MIVSQIQALASTTCLPWLNQLKRAQSVRYLSTSQPAQAGQTCYRTSTLPAHHILADKHNYNIYAGLLGAMLVGGPVSLLTLALYQCGALRASGI